MKWYHVPCQEFLTYVQVYAERRRNEFKHEQILNTVDNGFVSAISDVKQMTKELSQLKQTPKKFICINDDMDHELIDETKACRRLIHNYYLEMFPNPSEFELPL